MNWFKINGSVDFDALTHRSQPRSVRERSAHERCGRAFKVRDAFPSRRHALRDFVRPAMQVMAPSFERSPGPQMHAPAAPLDLQLRFATLRRHEACSCSTRQPETSCRARQSIATFTAMHTIKDRLSRVQPDDASRANLGNVRSVNDEPQPLSKIRGVLVNREDRKRLEHRASRVRCDVVRNLPSAREP